MPGPPESITTGEPSPACSRQARTMRSVSRTCSCIEDLRNPGQRHTVTGAQTFALYSGLSGPLAIVRSYTSARDTPEATRLVISSSISRSNAATGCAPDRNRPLTKNAGVPRAPNVSPWVGSPSHNRRSLNLFMSKRSSLAHLMRASPVHATLRPCRPFQGLKRFRSVRGCGRAESPVHITTVGG